MIEYEKIYVKSGYELEDKLKETDHIPYREVHIEEKFIAGEHPKIKPRSNLHIVFDGGTSYKEVNNTMLCTITKTLKGFELGKSCKQ